MSDFKIPVYIINLKERIDRRIHIINEFRDKPEFEIFLFEAIRDNIGALGLWKSIRHIVEVAQNNEHDIIIICEDDHCFTENYDSEALFNALEQINHINADMLLGGVSHFEDSVAFDNNLFWLSGFTGFQFVILYRRFYSRFLKLNLKKGDDVDLKMQSISDMIFCIFPFISIQKEFGYSDVTKKNEPYGVVKGYFEKSEHRLKTISFLKNHFDNY
ncbi:hypothetical protein ACR777_02375 [Sphingobacterium spiritivorum]|uniref:hypothetical protein n=1 Tax=Sphingobacterium spiritivorum TaxID=258 RepID=UPI003DA4F550